MSLRSRLSASPTLSYTLMGCLFGFLFPIVSFSIRVVEMGLSFSLPALVEVHANSALQWIIDTAPLFLGLFAYIAGRRQQKVLELNRQLTRYIDDNRDQLIDQLQKSVIQSEDEAQRSLAQLRTAAQIAKQSTSFSADVPAATLNELLDKALNDSTQLISEQFGSYHVGIFLIESSSTATGMGQQYATLIASNSKGGQRMLKRGHKLKIGGPGVGTGIVGYVAAEGKPKIALDVGAEAVYFDNPDLPDTRSEMALPLIVSGNIIGVLDVQSTHSAAFGERDVVVMGLIAEGLSSTIDNARLILQLRSSLDEVRQLHQQYLQKAWSETLSLEKTLEYSSVVSPTADLAPKEVSSNPRLIELRIPIKLRDQIIGEISLEGVSGMQASDSTPSRNMTGAEAEKLREAWLPEEITLAEAVADQAAQALENARLLGETQRRAERERITATIAGKVWSFSDIDTILQTALQELGTSLDATDGYIQLKMAESKPVTETLPEAETPSPMETPPPGPLDAASSVEDISLTAAEEGDTSGE